MGTDEMKEFIKRYTDIYETAEIFSYYLSISDSGYAGAVLENKAAKLAKADETIDNFVSHFRKNKWIKVSKSNRRPGARRGGWGGAATNGGTDGQAAGSGQGDKKTEGKGKEGRGGEEEEGWRRRRRRRRRRSAWTLVKTIRNV